MSAFRTPRGSARQQLRPPRTPLTRASRRNTSDDRPAATGPVWPKISSALTALTAVGAVLLSGLTVRMTRDGQRTSRFSSAVEQLGSKETATRTGAIYALGRLARDSDYDRPVIISLLADYIRSEIGPDAEPAYECADNGPPPADVVAALRMLFLDITRKPREGQVDLRDVCLNQVDFPKANLSCMRLDRAVMDGANFAGASLRDTSLQNALLQGATFTGANFTRADASGARFGDLSPIASAGMEDTILQDTNLTGALLIDIDFTRADLTRTKLTYANLYGSTFSQAKPVTHLDDAMNLPRQIDRSRSLPGPILRPAANPASRCSEQPGRLWRQSPSGGR